MTTMDEICEIANRWAEMGIEVPPTALLGTQRMDQLIQEYHGLHNLSDNLMGSTIYTVWTSQGLITVSTNSEVSPDHLSIGRMTLHDIIIEDILLDDEDFFNIDNLN